jgi:CRP-like cAMP-binding protein
MRRIIARDIWSLGATPLFRGCSVAQLDNVQRLGTVVTAAPARELCHAGVGASQLVVVIAGRVLTCTPDGRQRLLGRGECFGGLAHSGRPDVEPESVVALTPVTLFVVGRREFAGLLEACPAFAARLERASETARFRRSDPDEARRIRRSRLRAAVPFRAPLAG